jgi:putative transposase
MALQHRRPEQVVHHSDQGSQYTSLAFGNRCRQMGVLPSTGTVGDAFDNAMAESFFASLECELIDRKTFKTPTKARLAVFTWKTPGGVTTPSDISHLLNFERRSTSIPESPKINL